jgi:ATP-binding cassette subfamily B protein
MSVNNKQIQKSFTLQQEQSDCGAACLLSIIKYYNGINTIDNIRRLSGTNIAGTTLLGLYQAANQLGFDAEGCESNIELLAKHEAPCILYVHTNHYVVFYGIILKNGLVKFIIGDPAKSIIYLDHKELDELWLTKRCLQVLPNNTFQKSTEIKNQKWQWIKNILEEDIPLLVIAITLGICITVLGVTMSIFSQRLIDDIIPKRNFMKLNLGVALVLCLLLVKQFLIALRQHFLLRQSKDLNIRIIDFFYQHLLSLPKPFFDSRKIGELTARMNDTSRIQGVITQLVGNVAIDALVVLVSIIFIFLYSLAIGIVCIAVLPFFFILIYLHQKKIIDGQRNIMSSYAIAESNYISTLQGIEAIKNNNLQSQFSLSNKTIYQNYQNKLFSLGTIQLKLNFWASSFGALFLISVLLFAANLVMKGNLKTGELMAILGMCSSLMPSVGNLAMISIPVNEAKIAFDRMFEFTGIPPETDSHQTIKSVNPFSTLSVQNVSFRFAGRSQILKDVSFEVSKGEIIAIMGENGSGKSTLTQIIQKFYKLQSGDIVINGESSLNEIPALDWRNNLGIVPQNIHIFNGTAIENIAFADAVHHTGKVIQFLEEFGFDTFISSLPQSYMTLVGEDGINLSGGQKQMIAFARALYRSPELLILDEATAAMDRNSEQFVLKLLMKLKTKTAVIFITHRLHVLKSFCDRIYILENGKITAFGKHDKLLQSVNLYSNYWSDLLN